MEVAPVLLKALCTAIERIKHKDDLFLHLEAGFNLAAPVMSLRRAALMAIENNQILWEWNPQDIAQSNQNPWPTLSSDCISNLEAGQRFFLIDGQGLAEDTISKSSIVILPVKCNGALSNLLLVEKEAPSEMWIDEEIDFLSGLALLTRATLESSGVNSLENEISRQVLSRRWVEVQENERRQIARELHDEAAQALSSLLIGLKLVEKETDQTGKALEHLAELRRMTIEIMNNLHRLAVGLRPPTLDHLGLVSALEQLLEQIHREFGLEVQFEAIGLDEFSLNADIKTAIYRIVQEAVNNIHRHAEVLHAAILLEARSNKIILVVEDHGKGFDPLSALEKGRLGLIGIYERAAMFGGKLTIESRLGDGTTLFIEVPNETSYSSC